MHKDFITQYILANSGTMVPAIFTRWAALYTISATIGRQVYVDHEHFIIRPNVYIVFVGRMGSRKTTAMRLSKKMYRKAFPNQTISPAVASSEKIAEMLSRDEAQRAYPDAYPIKGEAGTCKIYTPCTFFINELKNFIKINIESMIDFLTDIYDEEDVYDCATIKHGLQPIIEPCINILACETPKWIIDKLKKEILTGGISRRLIYVYFVGAVPRITFPKKTKEAKDAELWCIEHLHKIVKLTGKFEWTPDGAEWFDNWFTNLEVQQDEVLEGFYEAKDVLVTKIAMALAMAEPEPKLVLTKEILETAVAFLESIEDNLPLLTVGQGRNELAVPMQRMMQLLKDNDGWMPEHVWHKIAGQDLTEGEYMQMKMYFKSTRQLHEGPFEIKTDSGTITETMVVTMAKYKDMKAKGEIK